MQRLWVSSIVGCGVLISSLLISQWGNVGLLKPVSANPLWTTLASATGSSLSQATANNQRVFQLNSSLIEQTLNRAPKEGEVPIRQSQAILQFPLPDGTFLSARIAESPIVEPPSADIQIRTFTGQGIEDPTATLRFDWSPDGLHALLLTSQGSVFVRPAGDPNHPGIYVSSFGTDADWQPGQFQCGAMPQEIVDQKFPSIQEYRLESDGLASGGVFNSGSDPTSSTKAPGLRQAAEDRRYAAQSIPAEMAMRLQSFSNTAYMLKTAQFTANNGWMIVYGYSGFFARNIPQAAFDRALSLNNSGNELFGVYFSPSNGWVILYGQNQFAAQGIPTAMQNRLQTLANENRVVKHIAFTATGGWVILSDYNQFFSDGIPADAQAALTELAGQAEELKSIAFTSNTQWVIMYGNARFRASSASLSSSLQARLTQFGQENRNFRSAALTADGNGWVILAAAPPLPVGNTLRTYRLAVSATGEYTQRFGNGNVTRTFESIVQRVNFANAIYEREMAVRFLVVNDQDAIFTSGSSDPFTNGNPREMDFENVDVLNGKVGATAYDLGHAFGTVGEGGTFGTAFFGLCDPNFKALGATCFGVAEDTPLSTYTLVHEMGHQQFANHTFNGSSRGCGNGNRQGVAAVEPASGTTIMGYGPTGCGEESLGFKPEDIYFHAFSLTQMLNAATEATPGSCAAPVSTGNQSPQVTAGPDLAIPAKTPFALTASATDPEGDPLTYCWEEIDVSFAQSPPNTDEDGRIRPLFRSFPPTTSPMRTFPQLTNILQNKTQLGESLPTQNRVLKFQITVRDNHAGGGGVNFAQQQLRVVATSEPFEITSQSKPQTFEGGTVQTVTWKVAQTDVAPINCAEVRILLSADGGRTFPTVLADRTANDGAHTIVVPQLTTQAGRIKVEAVGNVFFDISNVNFEVKPGTSTDTQPPTVTLLAPNGGESFTIGSGIPVRWNSTDNAGVASHSLELSLDGGGTFPISAAAALDGSVQAFTFTATDQFASMRARVRITAQDAAGNKGLDASDADFAIVQAGPDDTEPPQVTVTSPTGGKVKVSASKSFTVAWQSRDNVGVSSQDVGLSIDSGTTFPTTLATGLAGTVQSLELNSTLIGKQKSKTARLRITARDAAGNSGTGTSPVFTLVSK